MLSSKSKSSMSDSSSNKSMPGTPRVSRIGRLGSAKVDPNSSSPKQNARLSVERSSPRSVNSKPSADRRSPGISTPSDKQPRSFKGSELQAQLTLVQEDLKKAREKLASEEEEKARALEELKEAKKAVEEANEKLEDALLSQKIADESSELDKFRADEVEQSAIEAAQKREEEWLEELGNVRNHHAVDVAALISSTQELQRAKQELAMITEAKNTALVHADDAMRIAEMNVEKVEMLSGEITHLKSLLHSELESHSKEMSEIINKFNSEAEDLKLEFGKAKAAEKKLVDVEASVEMLKIQLFNAKMSESNALGLVDDQKKKLELLDSQLEEASRSESAAKCSLTTATKQIEEREAEFHDAKSEINSLNFEVARLKEDLKESDRKLELRMQEVLDAEKSVEVLKSEIQELEKEKEQALNNEKIACLNVESLAQENNKLAVELEISKQESVKTKKSMESLASALHEFTMETRDTQERLFIKQGQLDIASVEIEEIKSALRNEHEKYEHIVGEAKYEIVCLKKIIEKSETEEKQLRVEWDMKELSLISVIQKSEEEISSIKLENDNVVKTMERQKNEANVAKEETSMLQDKMRLVEVELVATKKLMEQVMVETSNLKEKLLDKENEVQNVSQENDELLIRDAAASKKIEELSDLLAELASRKSKDNFFLKANGENGENFELDLLPITTEAIQEKIIETKIEALGTFFNKDEENLKLCEVVEAENANYKTEENHNVHLKLCEGDIAFDKQISSEREDNSESVEDEIDSKIVNSNIDHVNGENAKNSNKQQKKTKALLHKFGNILKKKSSPK